LQPDGFAGAIALMETIGELTLRADEAMEILSQALEQATHES
jgi:hypothetical protein